MWDFFCIFAADLLIAYHVLRQLQKHTWFTMTVSVIGQAQFGIKWTF